MVSIADIVIRIQVLVGEAKKKMDELSKKTRSSANKMSTAMKNNEMRFQGWAMSIMFFGMAIQRIFMSIWKSSTKVFQDVMHSVDGTVTEFDKLNSVSAYLGFALGNALAPVAGMLVPIIKSIADWVVNHEELTRKIVVSGIAIGTFLMVLGALVLGIAGLVSAVKHVVSGIQILIYVFRAAGGWATSLGGIFSKLTSLLGTMKAAVIANATAFGTMSTAAKLGFLGVVGGIIVALAWIFRLKDQIGGWGEFFKSVLRGILRVGAIVAAGLGAGFGFAIEKIVQALNWLVARYNSIAGKLGFKTVGSISTTGFGLSDMYSRILNDLLTRTESGALSPQKGYASNANPLDIRYAQERPIQVNIAEVRTDGTAEDFVRMVNDAARWSS